MATQMWERSSGRFVAIVAAVLILSAVVPGAGAVLSTPASSPAQLASGPVHQQGVETDSVRLIVSVQPDGSSNWTVQYWTRLDDENTTDAFESLQSDIEANPSNYSDRFATRMRSTVSSAENATGREMSASEFDVQAETRTPPQYGVVTYTFQWDGFAAVQDDTLRIGDAIEGIFLDDRTRLVIEWPSGYTPTEVRPEPDERRSEAVVWRGAETSFVSGEPSVVLQPSAAGTTVAGGNGGGDTTTPPSDDSGSALPLLGAGLAIALLVTAAWTYRDRFRGERKQGTAAPSAEGQTTATGGETAAEGQTTATREDLLSNEERVVQFVRDQGGRVKQQEIVEAFDWTEARTSQIVRDLRDEGKLEGFRLGRENVLKLPDEDETTD
ncbi:helix-turn-helix transcriptional regulator [Haloplanus halobius]|uniref:helix-turn-helix transcriptional regulator n=1 Tax=Haloplanus halobius TaxID=2934938 RepID=UPI00200C404C|nr:hypothetical protein [Haloplanus sp. XH21]